MRRSRAIIASDARRACAACERGLQGVDSFAPRISRYGEEENHHSTEDDMNTKALLARIGATVALILLAATAIAQAPQRLPYGTAITLETAKKVAAGAAAEATKNKWTAAIAIVDNHGFLVYYEMFDDTQTA